jgi:hypothetical protein
MAIFQAISTPPFLFMTTWLLILHLFNFVLPALAMATLMPWAGYWVMRSSSAVPVRRRMAVHAICGVGVLVVGLVFQGQDGQMATYAALVLLAATAEWAMHRGWKKI